LLQRADIAMYHAKRNGMGHAFYESDMDSDKLTELTLEADLRKALENDELEVYYQPKINLARSRITSVEALLRWQHPVHGFVPPDKFVALAEQTGLIHTLTQWVLNTALAQCAYWTSKGKYIGVSVNMSAQSLTDNSTLDMIRQALEDTKVMPNNLTLELTETAVMTDAAKAQEILVELDKMGVRLSIDDFGTGYSSLAYLKRLPVDEIKIDKAFVMDMGDDVNDAVIVRSTIDLAHNMGLSVVAEGVETQEIWNMLSGLGCNVGQGYFMCRPCPASEIDAWLEESPWGLAKEKSSTMS
jgi:EAL domain-containing protein (putative c-di-GMP-specific phosphodiesterase class I)